MDELRVEALRSLGEVARLRVEIDALNLVSRRPCPFSTFEYLATFLAHDEHARANRKLLFLVAFEGPRLVGYLPLCTERERVLGLPFGRVGVLVSHDTDRPHAIARTRDEPRCCEAFYRYLLERERGWSSLELVMQDAASGLQVLPVLARWRFHARRFETMPNTTVPLPFATFAEYFHSLAGAPRRNVSRLGRRLLGAGRVEAVACTDPRGRRTLLELYLDVERRSWKHRARAGVTRDPRRVAFFEALCQEHQPLHLGFDLVLLDDLPIAGLVSGAFADHLYALEMAFDRDYDELAPGHLLAMSAIRRAIEAGYRSINFKGNYAYYKARLGGVVTPTSAVQIYRVGSVPWLKARAGELRRRLRPPPVDPGGFNPARRRVVDVEPEARGPREPRIRPEREAEREGARATLRSLEEQAVRLERLSGTQLEAALSFAAHAEPAPHHAARSPEAP